ncbi:hypothetical protein ABPG75_009442 [Micractinium tetrahymenae]
MPAIAVELPTAADERLGPIKPPPAPPRNTLSESGFDTSALDGLDYARNISELVGRTPLVLVQQGDDGRATILGKLEAFQPLASVKDRMARAMIEDAEEKGLITPGKTILVEATSGNTGVALAYLAAARGYEIVITMPDFCSLERRVLQKIFGAKLLTTDPTKGCIGAFEKALEVLESTPNTYMLNQFDNKANPNVHYRTTGPEIWKATKGRVDIFISGVGTGGTVTGVGRYLKEKNPDVKIVAVEPVESAVITAKLNGTEAERQPHWIQGMGAGFVPPVLDTDLLDEVVTVTSEEAVAASRRLAREQGIFVGISSGATATAAAKLAARPENAGKVIVAMFASFGERYLSTPLFEEVAKEAREQKHEPWVAKVPFHL